MSREGSNISPRRHEVESLPRLLLGPEGRSTSIETCTLVPVMWGSAVSLVSGCRVPDSRQAQGLPTTIIAREFRWQAAELLPIKQMAVEVPFTAVPQLGMLGRNADPDQQALVQTESQSSRRNIFLQAVARGLNQLRCLLSIRNWLKSRNCKRMRNVELSVHHQGPQVCQERTHLVLLRFL